MSPIASSGSWHRFVLQTSEAILARGVTLVGMKPTGGCGNSFQYSIDATTIGWPVNVPVSTTNTAPEVSVTIPSQVPLIVRWSASSGTSGSSSTENSA